MLEGLKKQWRSLRADLPGSRFRRRHERRSHARRTRFAKIGGSLAGVIVIAVGLVLLAVPGPGIPVVAVGIAMLAQESFYLALALDWLEAALRGGRR